MDGKTRPLYNRHSCQLMNLSRLTRGLVAALNHRSSIAPEQGGDKIVISRTVSAMAVLYERIRVAMEYKEEHILRRSAIERIIKRRLMLNENGRNVSEHLLKELLWAQYIPENSISIKMISVVQKTIDKYIFLRNEIGRRRKSTLKGTIHEWLISTCAAEIEEKLVPDTKREAFINFIFQYYRDKVFLKDEDDETKEIQVYIAVHRAFAKSDNDLIRYELLKLSYPDLLKKTWMDLNDETSAIYTQLTDINTHLSHEIGSKMTRAIKKEIAPFLIMQDIYESKPDEFVSILEDEKQLEHHVDVICKKRYEEIGKKLARAGVRSVIYIFLTKMVFAIGLEYPFDKYIVGEFNYIALGINTLFPPILMAMALAGNSPPGQDNTKRVIARIKEIVYQESTGDQRISLTLKTPKMNPVLSIAFSILYVVAFLLVFGSIVWLLTLLKFNLASMAIFIFFVTVVVFFAYRVRQLGREYILRRRESLLSPIVNFFLLPILNVGKWLSNEVAKINVLIAFFDFVIEAPFKAIFGIFEEWFSFMRSKKEEII